MTTHLTLPVGSCAACTRPGRWRPTDGTVTHSGDGDAPPCQVRQTGLRDSMWGRARTTRGRTAA